MEEDFQKIRLSNIKGKINLVYFIRAFFDWIVGCEEDLNQEPKETIEYIACGWEGEKNKILFKIFPNGEIERTMEIK